eukprot:jgi/Galph1/5959/GphlegSOOS_G4607.1
MLCYALHVCAPTTRSFFSTCRIKHNIMRERNVLERRNIAGLKIKATGLSNKVQSNFGIEHVGSNKANTMLYSTLRAFDGVVHLCSQLFVMIIRQTRLHKWIECLPADRRVWIQRIQVIALIVAREFLVFWFLVKWWPKLVRLILRKLQSIGKELDLLGASVLNKVARKENKEDVIKSGLWSDTIIEAAEQPLTLSLWVIALLRLANVGSNLGSATIHAVDNLLHIRLSESFVGHGLGKLCFVLLFGRFLERWRKLLFENIKTDSKNGDSLDRSLLLAYERLMQAANLLIISFLLYEYVGISFAPLFAISGLGGVALSLASRDFVSNIFGSIMIYFTRPFTIGDKIRSKDGIVSGTVEKIGWYSSQVLNDERLVVFVPNSTFTSAVITNLSRAKHVPFSKKIYVAGSYLQDVEKVVANIRSRVANNSAVDAKESEPVVFVSDVKNGCIEIEIECLLKNMVGCDERLGRQNLVVDIAAIEKARHCFSLKFYRIKDQVERLEIFNCLFVWVGHFSRPLTVGVSAMRLERCYVCSSTIYPGHGTMFIRNDAKCFRFCRSKCRKTFHMKRNPRYLRWTKAYRKSHGKEMAIDSTFEMERKRQRIQRYDRQLVGKTLQAIQKVDTIRTQRGNDYYKNRMKQSRKQVQKSTLREVQRGISLVEPDILKIRTAVKAREGQSQKVVKQTMAQNNNQTTE